MEHPLRPNASTVSRTCDLFEASRGTTHITAGHGHAVDTLVTACASQLTFLSTSGSKWSHLALELLPHLPWIHVSLVAFPHTILLSLGGLQSWGARSTPQHTCSNLIEEVHFIYQHGCYVEFEPLQASNSILVSSRVFSFLAPGATHFPYSRSSSRQCLCELHHTRVMRKTTLAVEP